MKRLLLLSVLAGVISLFTTPVGATIRDATQTAFYETSSAMLYGFTTPTLAALQGDTTRISIALPEDVPYFALSTGPLWRICIGGRWTSTGCDSIAVEPWVGRTSALYRTAAFASCYLKRNATKTIDLTAFPLTTWRRLTFYVKNVDSSATATSIDVTIIRGR